MPTSGITIWDQTRNEIISTALRKLGALSEGQILSSEDIHNGTVALNGIVSAFQTLGMPLWERREFLFPLSANTESYNIGVGQTVDIPFPLKVHEAYLVNINTGQHTEMEIKSVYDWLQIRTGASSSYPVFVNYVPRIDFGTLSVWPIPNAQAASLYRIKCVGQQPFEVMTAATDNLDFPKEWHLAIVFELAVTLASEYGASAQERADLQTQAKKWLDMAKDFGMEDASIFFQVNRGS